MVLGFRAAILVGVFAIALFTPVTALCEDVDDLRATFEQSIAAFNKHDCDTYI